MTSKILHVLYHSLPTHSGYAFRSHDILLAQKRKGWEPVALTAPEVGGRSFGDGPDSVDGVVYYRSGTIPGRVNEFNTELRLTRNLARKIEEVAGIEKPDLLHAHSPVSNAIAARHVGRRLGIPVVYEIRAFWEDAAVQNGGYRENSFTYRLVKTLETQLCKKTPRIVAICAGLKEDLLQRGIPRDSISVVPNGVDLYHFKDASPDREYARAWGLDGKRVIGFVGSFYPYEGLDLLVDAMTHLAGDPTIVLLLVGGGRVAKSLEEQVDRLRLRDRVLMPGRLPHERIPGVYGLFDILVYPRLATRLTECVTPLKPLEAMAAGKAVVASNIGGHRELIQDGKSGLLFPPGDTMALANAVRRLLDRSKLRQTLAGQGCSWVHKERSWDQIMEIYREVYEGTRRDPAWSPIEENPTPGGIPEL